MLLVRPSVERINESDRLKKIELCGRLAYKSADKITENSSFSFVNNLIKSNHLSVLEHASIIIKVSFLKFLLLNIFKSNYFKFSYANKRFLVSANVRAWMEYVQEEPKKRNWIAETILFHDASCIPFFSRIKDVNWLHPEPSTGCAVLTESDLVGEKEILTHKRVSFKFITSRSVSHQIVRHRLMSFCISGNSILKSFSGGKKWTIKELYEWQSDPKRKGRLKLINLRSVDESTNIIIPNKISKVYYNGVKQTFKVTTESGRSISTTKDHKFYTPNGYVKLESLNVGDYIYSNGIELLDNKDWLYDQYIVQNKTRKELSKIIGCCESYVNRSFRKFNIVKSHKDFPNRKPGCGKKNSITKLGREKLAELRSGSKNYFWKPDRSEITGYYECHFEHKQKKVECECCGSKANLEFHHLDKNPNNNKDENIKILCSKCHKDFHAKTAKAAFRDRIVSIEFDKEEDVYDIEMTNPYHNYVSNGLIVHNCQESQRYCNYSKEKFGQSVTFCIPHWAPSLKEGEPDSGYKYTPREELFLSSLSNCEQNYFTLIKEGCKAEDAREVLPNATKTEIIVTGNINDWKHFLNLRLPKSAHPEIRILATEIQKLI